MKNNLEKKRRFDYKWVVIGVSFLMVFTSLGFCSSPKGLFIDPITETLEIGRTEYSVTDTMRYVATAVLNLFFGTLIVKFGPKKLAIAGGVSANKLLRETLQKQTKKAGIEFYVPKFEYCTDNASMVACAAYYKLKDGRFDDLSMNANPALDIGQK